MGRFETCPYLVRPLTLREGGGRPQGASLRLGDGVVLVVFGGAGASHYVADSGHEFGHLHGEDEFGGFAGCHLFEGVHVLEGHGVSAEAAGGVLDSLEGVGESVGSQYRSLLVAFGLEDLGLSGAFGFEDFGLLLPFCDGDGGFAFAVGFEDHGASHAFGGHLAGHGGLDVGGGFDLSDFYVGDFDAPASGLLVESGADELVDALALRQDLVQADVTDDCAERGGCETDYCRGVCVRLPGRPSRPG